MSRVTLSRAGAALLSGAILALCCAAGKLPDYAAPVGGIVDISQVPAGNLIAYRSLARGDFLASQPPANFAPHQERVGAATCAYVLSAPETQVAVTPVEGRDGAPAFEARLRNLGFRAFMDRHCSWWNTQQKELPPDYVLQHEQIHFALFELEARRLDARSGEISEAARTTAGSAKAAAERARQSVEAELEKTLRRALARNREFDEDTSFGYRPERQRAWWEQVQRELADSAR